MLKIKALCTSSHREDPPGERANSHNNNKQSIRNICYSTRLNRLKITQILFISDESARLLFVNLFVFLNFHYVIEANTQTVIGYVLM